MQSRGQGVFDRRDIVLDLLLTILACDARAIEPWVTPEAISLFESACKRPPLRTPYLTGFRCAAGQIEVAISEIRHGRSGRIAVSYFRKAGRALAHLATVCDKSVRRLSLPETPVLGVDAGRRGRVLMSRALCEQILARRMTSS